MLLTNHSLPLPFPPKPLHRNRNIRRNISASAAPLESLSSSSPRPPSSPPSSSSTSPATSLPPPSAASASASYPLVSAPSSPASSSPPLASSSPSAPSPSAASSPSRRLRPRLPRLLHPLQRPHLLRNRPLPDHILIVSASIAANLVFAYSLLFAQVLSVGFPVQSPLPGILVLEVKPNSAAASVGLLPDDVILSSPSVHVGLALLCCRRRARRGYEGTTFEGGMELTMRRLP